MKITLRQMLYFDALAQELHFGRAAGRVSVTQPAMSAQIRDLEALLGGELVDRSGAGLALTPLGRAVADRARAVLDAARDVEALASDAVGTSLAIRLGLIPTVAPYLAPRFIGLVAETDLDVSISEALTARLLDAVRRGDLDAAVIALPSGAKDLYEISLFPDAFLLALPNRSVRPGWIAPARPEEIDPKHLLLLDDGHCLADQALAACALRREHVQLFLGATSLTTVSRLVASGQGITLIPEIAASIEGAGLTLHRFDAPEPGRTIGLIARRGAAGSAWLARLADLLRSARLDVPASGST